MSITEHMIVSRGFGLPFPRVGRQSIQIDSTHGIIGSRGSQFHVLSTIPHRLVAKSEALCPHVRLSY